MYEKIAVEHLASLNEREALETIRDLTFSAENYSVRDIIVEFWEIVNDSGHSPVVFDYAIQSLDSSFNLSMDMDTAIEYFIRYYWREILLPQIHTGVKSLKSKLKAAKISNLSTGFKVHLHDYVGPEDFGPFLSHFIKKHPKHYKYYNVNAIVMHWDYTPIHNQRLAFYASILAPNGGLSLIPFFDDNSLYTSSVNAMIGSMNELASRDLKLLSKLKLP